MILAYQLLFERKRYSTHAFVLMGTLSHIITH